MLCPGTPFRAAEPSNTTSTGQAPSVGDSVPIIIESVRELPASVEELTDRLTRTACALAPSTPGMDTTKPHRAGHRIRENRAEKAEMRRLRGDALEATSRGDHARARALFLQAWKAWRPSGPSLLDSCFALLHGWSPQLVRWQPGCCLDSSRWDTWRLNGL